MAHSVSFGTSVPVLAVVNGVPTTTSLDVAGHFGKRHERVLDAIRTLLPQLPAEAKHNFVLSEYADATGRALPAYRITRDGFTLLAMGFTGARALEFKLAYLDAFNRLEAEVAQRALPAPTVVPDIDVAALLLSGQSDPVPLTPAQYRLVDQRAYALSADAHALIREHLLRAVAFHTTCYAREEAGHTALVQLLDSITLGKALTHHHLNHAHVAAMLLATAHDLIGKAHARLQADLKTAGQSAHARH